MNDQPRPLRIDFVSDVSCPWCAIGLQSLEQAIARVGDAARVELHFQPFELNPQLAPEGEDAVAHLREKYGISEAQVRQNGEAIRARGAELGFVFDMQRRRHVWNTFDAHRLLHWAETQDLQLQRALKHALLRAYFSEGENVSDRDVLARIASSVGLDAERAREVLASGEYAEQVRERERFYTGNGIHAVPSVIFDQRHLVQGGQPVEQFERVLRQLSAEPAA
ncbi:DsbA family oxidoreductase [Luteimonas aquatica]|uniref:DsbA family oxidoreductase n=1 Tax=Luteimonas aquatica TaxID=450364 RepID=UPI001F5A048A|nr:DsbA family oxidoreductase [Luteimonas aquatica]